MNELQLTKERLYSWEGFYISWSIPIGYDLERPRAFEAYKREKVKFLQLLNNVGFSDVNFDSLVTEYRGQGNAKCIAFHSLPKDDYLTLLLVYYRSEHQQKTLDLIVEYVAKHPQKALEAYKATMAAPIKELCNALIDTEITQLENELTSLKSQRL